MTQKRVLELAYFQALSNWGKEKDRLEALPDNEITKSRERKAYNELVEISELLHIEENKDR